MSNPNAVMIEARAVEKWYPNGFHALRGVDLSVHQGEVVVIMGPSGSGKSTFLRTFNALEDFQQGSIVVDGIALNDDLRQIDAVRREGARLIPDRSNHSRAWASVKTSSLPWLHPSRAR